MRFRYTSTLPQPSIRAAGFAVAGPAGLLEAQRYYRHCAVLSRYEEFSDILTCVREAIEADQLEGALCGQYDSGIVARVLHLADRQDVTTNGKEITTATQPISVVLDPEAAKIIQSIGRRTVKE